MREHYKLCLQCGNFSHSTEEQIFCMLCGAKLVEKCPCCQEPIYYPTAKFCPACGQLLVVSGEMDRPNVNVMNEPKTRRGEEP